jgi:hypothetical protein
MMRAPASCGPLILVGRAPSLIFVTFMDVYLECQNSVDI